MGIAAEDGEISTIQGQGPGTTATLVELLMVLDVAVNTVDPTSSPEAKP